MCLHRGQFNEWKIPTMKKLIKSGVTVLAALAMSAGMAMAGGHGTAWNLVNEESKVSFGSVKAGVVGEIHRFKSLAGGVDDNGAASIEIDLASVDTGIEIRDTRMQRHVFAGKGPTSTMTATVDPAAINGLGAGETTVVPVVGKLVLGDVALDINTVAFVARLTDSKVMITTDEMVMVGTEPLGINAGVDELMKLAGLPSIGRVVPVTFRLMLEKAK